MGHLHLHPIVVHFPIALFITAFGLELLSLVFKKEILHQTALCNYILAILSAVAAVLSALWDGQHLRHPVFYTHRALAIWTLAVALSSGIILSLIKRKSKRLFRIIFFISLLVVVSLVSVTGFYGGRLVYEYGVGVEE